MNTEYADEHPVAALMKLGYEMQLDPAVVAFMLRNTGRCGEWQAVEADSGTLPAFTDSQISLAPASAGE